MGKRKGSLLEQQLAKMLILVGLKPETNKIFKDYEIDVFLRYGSNKIAFECKQYEKGGLVVRNIIHQWASKNNELGFDKIVLVIYGNQIQFKDRELAKRLGIIIWDERKFNKLFDGAISEQEDFLGTILKEAGLTEQNEIQDKDELEIRRRIDSLLDDRSTHLTTSFLLINNNARTKYYLELERSGFSGLCIHLPIQYRNLFIFSEVITPIEDIKRLLSNKGFEEINFKRIGEAFDDEKLKFWYYIQKEPDKFNITKPGIHIYFGDDDDKMCTVALSLLKLLTEPK